MVWDGVVGIVTVYRIDSLGIYSQCSEILCTHSDLRGACPGSYTVGTGSFPGVKWLWHGVNRPPASSAEVKERGELYFFPSVCSWHVLGRTLLLRLQL